MSDPAAGKPSPEARRAARLRALDAGEIRHRGPAERARPRKAAPLQDAVYDVLAAVAAAGAPMPSCQTIAGRVTHVTTAAGINTSIWELTRKGRIRVERRSGERRVRVDGRWTDWSAPAARRDRLVTVDGVGGAMVLGVPVDRFRALYGDPALDIADIAERLGRTVGAVTCAARKLGVRRPKRPAAPKPKPSGRARRASTGAWSWDGNKTAAVHAARIAAAAARRAKLRREREAVAVDAVAALADAGGRFGRCQWIEGPAAGRDFCGAATDGLSSWCAAHEKRVFLRPKSEEGAA